MSDDRLPTAQPLRPRVLDTWSPAPFRVKMERSQGADINHSNALNNDMLLNRWRELAQERVRESRTSFSSTPALADPSLVPTLPNSIDEDDIGLAQSGPEHGSVRMPRLNVNGANGHISIVTGPLSLCDGHSMATGEHENNGSNTGRTYRTNPSGYSPSNLPLSPVTEGLTEEDGGEGVALVFLGVVFGVIPSQWYPKSLTKWQSGIEVRLASCEFG